MKFTAPPGAFDENIEAGPPRTTSMRSIVSSRRNAWSALSQPSPGSCWTGSPSSSMPTALNPSSRNAAHADVRTRLAAGGFDPEARHGAERIGDAERRVHAQRIAVDRRDRVAHFHFANVFDTSAAGDDHSFDVIRRLLLGVQRRCSSHREHSSDGPTDERAARIRRHCRSSPRDRHDPDLEITLLATAA